IYRQGDHLRPGFEIAADVKAGDSGGGIVGADGSLLGLVWATSREVDGQAWALPVEAIDPLMSAVDEGQTPAAAAGSRCSAGVSRLRSISSASAPPAPRSRSPERRS